MSALVDAMDQATTVRLRDWLAAAETGPVGDHLHVRLIAGGRSNPTYELTDGQRHWILRRPPSATSCRQPTTWDVNTAP